MTLPERVSLLECMQMYPVAQVQGTQVPTKSLRITYTNKCLGPQRLGRSTECSFHFIACVPLRQLTNCLSVDAIHSFSSLSSLSLSLYLSLFFSLFFLPLSFYLSFALPHTLSLFLSLSLSLSLHRERKYILTGHSPGHPACASPPKK